MPANSFRSPLRWRALAWDYPDRPRRSDVRAAGACLADSSTRPGTSPDWVPPSSSLKVRSSPEDDPGGQGTDQPGRGSR